MIIGALMCRGYVDADDSIAAISFACSVYHTIFLLLHNVAAGGGLHSTVAFHLLCALDRGTFSLFQKTFLTLDPPHPFQAHISRLRPSPNPLKC